jgi:hypothetical protein
MAKRPAGVKALVSAFSAYDFPLENLRAFDRPVYLGYGLLSNEAEERKAGFLAKLFPLITVEAYPNLHHFTPPQRHEPQRFAEGLRNLWSIT